MSAASPAPLPRGTADADPGAPSGHAGPATAGRPSLVVAGGPGTASAAAEATSGALSGRLGRTLPPGTRGAPGPCTGPEVRLAPRAEPPASPLPADGPAHVRPPVLASPEATARRRPLADVAEEPGTEGPPPALPDPTRLCCAVVQAAVEGMRGVRPLAQLVRWVTPEVYERLALRARLVQDSGVSVSPARAGIRRVRVCRIGDCAAEVTVVVDDGPRVRAVALRVEEHRGRWRATVLEIG